MNSHIKVKIEVDSDEDVYVKAADLLKRTLEAVLTEYVPVEVVVSV